MAEELTVKPFALFSLVMIVSLHVKPAYTPTVVSIFRAHCSTLFVSSVLIRLNRSKSACYVVYDVAIEESLTRIFKPWRH